MVQCFVHNSYSFLHNFDVFLLNFARHSSIWEYKRLSKKFFNDLRIYLALDNFEERIFKWKLKLSCSSKKHTREPNSRYIMRPKNIDHS